MFLRKISKAQSFFDVGDTFGLGETTANLACKEIARILASHKSEYIRLPTEDTDLENVLQGFRDRGMPQAAGA
eukprot:CAMPEP_0198229940 /NCGR_PEP_ID=MMETSP1445-20131203/114386_1 /TAXON_ID=36898 /ORGANISM="Pyramimonas sp., Strain CCMP2087" /LENGTH=72 /DNA_ID=CAMNT_0043910423 /DNA_START=1101 /DNA_END=1319 /DNA_ORIENTATION=+